MPVDALHPTHKPVTKGGPARAARARRLFRLAAPNVHNRQNASPQSLSLHSHWLRLAPFIYVHGSHPASASTRCACKSKARSLAVDSRQLHESRRSDSRNTGARRYSLSPSRESAPPPPAPPSSLRRQLHESRRKAAPSHSVAKVHAGNTAAGHGGSAQHRALLALQRLRRQYLNLQWRY